MGVVAVKANKMKFLALFLLIAAASVAESKKDYTGHQVISVTTRNEDDIRHLNKLRDTRVELDFWLNAKVPGEAAEIKIAPEFIDDIVNHFNAIGMKTDVQISNLQEIIDWETENNKRIEEYNKKRNVGFAFNQYHSYDELTAYAEELAAANADVSVSTIGTSVEGRDIKMLTIGTGGKPVQFFDCMVHAREWIAGALCAWTANELINGDNGLKDQFDFKMVIAANPDGYEYSREHDRMWRKNRAHGFLDICRGVDPNRNWDINHCGEGASTIECAENYCGPEPFSEPMTRALRDAISSTPNVVFAYSLHSYSQLVLSAYSYTHDLPSDYDALEAVMAKGAPEIEAVHGKHYNYGPGGPTIYIASGVSTDWYYKNAGVHQAYTFECRPLRSSIGGFILPAEEIIPNSEEVFAFVKTASALYLQGNL